jgi:hypothetical protein
LDNYEIKCLYEIIKININLNDLLS